MSESSKTVKVKALKAHSYNAVWYEAGSLYDIDEQYADSVANQGMAVRVVEAETNVATENPQTKAAANPLTTADVPTRTVARPAKKK